MLILPARSISRIGRSWFSSTAKSPSTTVSISEPANANLGVNPHFLVDLYAMMKIVPVYFEGDAPAAEGISTLTRNPESPAAVARWIRPLCSEIISWEMASPRPLPSVPTLMPR